MAVRVPRRLGTGWLALPRAREGCFCRSTSTPPLSSLLLGYLAVRAGRGHPMLLLSTTYKVQVNGKQRQKELAQNLYDRKVNYLRNWQGAIYLPFLNIQSLHMSRFSVENNVL